MSPITLEQYFGQYIDHPDATDERKANAAKMLETVNELYDCAAQDGCELPINPNTGSGVSGNGHGGFRPQGCPIGAPDSAHKTGHAVDRYDPHRQFASWCMAHQQELIDRGLHMEDPRWTASWVHLQDVPPRSGKVVYVPSADPAMASLPPQWSAA